MYSPGGKSEIANRPSPSVIVDSVRLSVGPVTTTVTPARGMVERVDCPAADRVARQRSSAVALVVTRRNGVSVLVCHDAQRWLLGHEDGRLLRLLWRGCCGSGGGAPQREQEGAFQSKHRATLPRSPPARSNRCLPAPEGGWASASSAVYKSARPYLTEPREGSPKLGRHSGAKRPPFDT